MQAWGSDKRDHEAVTFFISGILPYISWYLNESLNKLLSREQIMLCSTVWETFLMYMNRFIMLNQMSSVTLIKTWAGKTRDAIKMQAQDIRISYKNVQRWCLWQKPPRKRLINYVQVCFLLVRWNTLMTPWINIIFRDVFMFW